MFEQRLVTYLGARVPLLGGRLHPYVAPEHTPLPVGVYQITTNTRRTHDGHPLVNETVRVDVWAQTFAEVEAVLGELHQAMAAWQDADAQTARIQTEERFYEPAVDLFRGMITCLVCIGG